MHILFIILLTILGIVAGSFANVLVIRTRKGESIVRPGSHCVDCNHALRWYDNIPVLSYIILRGKCRDCSTRISIQYPLVELSTGFMFAALYYKFQPENLTGLIQLVLWFVVTTFLVAAFVYDSRWLELPDQFTLPAIGVALVLLIITGYTTSFTNIIPQVVATMVFGLVYIALWYFTQGKLLGGGDIRLALLMGLLLLVPQLLVAIFVAYVLGALTGLLLIVFKQKKRTDRIAFAPFLIIGLYFGLFFGTQISIWYLSLI